MDYGRAELADRLAAEYVVGTLRGPAKRRFETLLPAHPVLRNAVAQWQGRLHALDASVTPVEPPAHVWHKIEQQLFASASARSLPWWQRLGLWRGISAVASMAAVSLLVVSQLPAPPQAPIVVVLGANPDAAVARPARFVASVTSDGRAMVLRPIDAPPLTAAQALELWAVPPSGAPRSLGLLRTEGATTLLRAHLLDNTAAFAVSVEPAGGSPSGAPTGPIVSLGKLQL